MDASRLHPALFIGAASLWKKEAFCVYACVCFIHTICLREHVPQVVPSTMLVQLAAEPAHVLSTKRMRTPKKASVTNAQETAECTPANLNTWLLKCEGASVLFPSCV